MNRRLFAAMAAVLPTGVAETALASTPTPVSHPDSIAATVMHEFLTGVLGEGDLTAIADTFAPPNFELDSNTRFFEELLVAAEHGSDSSYFKQVLCFGDDDRALAFGQIGPSPYEAQAYFMGIWLRDGKIRYYRFMTELIETQM